jgi:hypothetical protein
MSKYTQLITITLTNAGGETITNPITDGASLYYITSGALTATGNFSFGPSGTMYEGVTYNYRYSGNIDLVTNSADLSFHGLVVPEGWGTKVFSVQAIYIGAAWVVKFELDMDQINTIITTSIVNEAVTKDKLEDLTDDHIWIGNSSNRPVELDLSASGFITNDSGTIAPVSVTGDVTITNAGVSSIGAGVIVNADVNASAAIARTKIANGTASYVIINDGSGTLSEEAQLSTTRGGTGQNLSASSGVLIVTAGTVSAASTLSAATYITDDTIQPSKLTQLTRTDVITKYISFETGFTGTLYQYMPYKGIVTYAKIRVIKAIAATDDATIQLKDDSGTNMTAGLITISASSAHGTGVAVTPTANNTFNPADELQFTVAKTTAGGVVELTLVIEREDS